MIQFKLYSKSPKDLTDKEAKEAKYRDTSKPSFIKPAAKVGALAGGALGLKKSLGKKGLGGTALRVGLGTLGGAWAGAKAGALADIGSSAVNYGGRRIAKSAKGAVKSVKDEAKKFSISDTPGKRAGLVAAGTTAGAVGGGGLGDIAVRYGYYRYQTDIMIVTVILLIVIVQIFQSVGMLIANKLDRRR
jgi:hypothetical protein